MSSVNWDFFCPSLVLFPTTNSMFISGLNFGPQLSSTLHGWINLSHELSSGFKSARLMQLTWDFVFWRMRCSRGYSEVAILDRLAVASSDEEVVGRCLLCKSAFDDYSARNRCSLCRLLVLICDSCQVSFWILIPFGSRNFMLYHVV